MNERLDEFDDAAQEYAGRIAGNDEASSIGPTPLIAAMRCYVASKLGNEVEIPEELKNDCSRCLTTYRRVQIKIKTSEATPIQINWLVAKCEGFDVYIPAFASQPWLQIRGDHGFVGRCPKWSTDWAQGGPIIEREGISLTEFKQGEVDDCDVGMWCAAYNRNEFGNDEDVVPRKLLGVEE